MPEVILTICVSVIMVALMWWAVIRLCRKNRVIAAWRPLLLGFAVVWGSFFVVYAHYLQLVIPVVAKADSGAHEINARDAADRLRAGDFRSAFERGWFSNQGFELYVGMIYAITRVPEDAVIGWFGFMAFCGLLTLLDVLVRATNATRVPFWVVLFIGLYPEGMIWSLDMLKEGPALWGLCTMLRFVVPDPTLKGARRWVAPVAGTVVFMLMRPYTAVPWLAAMVGAHVIKRRQWGTAILSSLGLAAAFSLALAMIPGIWTRITERGLINYFEGTFLANMSASGLGGSGVTYDQGMGTPIPFVSGLIMMFLRPFPHEAPHFIAFVSGMEVWVLTSIMVVSWLTFRGRLKLLSKPLILVCLFATLALSFVFTYQINLGTMVRVRMEFFPALIVFAASPGLARSAQFLARQGVHYGFQPAPIATVVSRPMSAPVGLPRRSSPFRTPG
jgi:hypothetical protein